MAGVLNKQDDREFLEYVSTHDIFILVETWLGKYHDLHKYFPTHKLYNCEGTRLNKFGRLSGGILVGVRDTVIDYVDYKQRDSKQFVTLKIKKQRLGLDRDIVLIGTYIQPKDSKFYYKNRDIQPFDELQEMIIEIKAQMDDEEIDFLILGDMNARLGTLQDFNNDATDDPDILADLNDSFNIPRQTCDKESNEFGILLQEFLITNHIHVLNGRSGEDIDGELTFISDSGEGGSVIDVCCASTKLYHILRNFRIACRTESDHLPVEVQIPIKTTPIKNSKEVDLRKRMVFKWKPEKEAIFITKLNNQKSVEKFQQIDTLLEEGVVNESIHALNEHIRKVGKDMEIKSCDKNTALQHQPPYFDKECKDLKKEKSRLLNRFRKDRSKELLAELREKKKEFRKLRKKKKSEENKKSMEELKTLPKENMWVHFKKKKQGGGVPKSISSTEISEYFENLLNNKTIGNMTQLENSNEMLENRMVEICEACSSDNDEILNTAITEEEVRTVIKHLPKNKACGIDGIPNEFLIHTFEQFPHIVVKLFNNIMETGEIPIAWQEAVIFPLHKSGQKNDVNNYRGISLLCTLAKVFTAVLNKRISKWMAYFDKNIESQAGFRKKYKTTDNIFNLRGLVEKYLSQRGGKVYTLFIDFAKAFDSIDRKKLFQRVHELGIHGRIYKVIQAIYSNTTACVWTSEGLGRTFGCDTGVRQGDSLSPTLFLIYINELEKELRKVGKDGIHTIPGGEEIYMLLFADDICIPAESKIALQRKINHVDSFCKKWHLNINLGKTKVIVHRKGGRIKQNEKWYLGSGQDKQEIATTNKYKYLGIYFTTELSMRQTTSHLAVQATKALNFLKYLIIKHKYIPFDTACRLFDALVLPVLLYGCETWGYEKQESIERVQIAFLKFFLGVKKRTNNMAVLGECGRFPLYISYHTRCIKYWLEIQEMPEHRYPKQIYLMLEKQHKAGRINWVSHIRRLLIDYDLEQVWETRNIDSKKHFLDQLKENIEKKFIRKWKDSITTADRLCIYKDLKAEFRAENYVTYLQDYRLRAALARLRCGSHNLKIETERGRKHVSERLCSHCNQIEDEYHFTAQCKQYRETRQKYLDTEFILTYDDFINLMCTTDTDKIIKLAWYTFQANKERDKEIG